MTQPYRLKAGEGWTYKMGINFTVKVSEVRAGSGTAVMEYLTRKGEEPESHTHATEDEIFYVLEGNINFHCAAKTFELEKGGMVFLPRGMAHTYTIPGDEPVRLLVITAPVREGAGGWGGFSADIELGQGELLSSPPQS
jgi:quercetin dioxygenase-like cupin family protein